MMVDSYAEMLAYGIKNRLNGFVVGPSGCGKSSGIRYMCSILEYPTRTFEFNLQSSLSALIGTRTVKQSDKGSYIEWVNGVALDCWEKGMILILEEVDAAPPGLLFALHSLLQIKSMYFEAPEKNNKLIKRHKDFCVIAVANTTGKGEDSHLYTGTNILNEAFLDRFSYTYRLSYLSEEDECSVLCNEIKGLHPKFAEAYVKCAALLRSSEDLKGSVLSTRRILEWAKVTQQVDWRKPVEFAESTMLNRMTKTNQEVARQVINNVWGSDERRMKDHKAKEDPSKIKEFTSLFGDES